MLISFSVGNFRSFKEMQTLDLRCGAINELRESNTFETPTKERLLKAAAVYGANGSGKSNLISALQFMRFFVTDSSKSSQENEAIGTQPFQLDTIFDKKPSFFEVEFIQGKTKYRYGFEVNRNEIVTEWLFYVPRTRETMLFTREQEQLTISSKFPEGQAWLTATKKSKLKVRKNALFLSTLAQIFGDGSTGKIVGWFQTLAVILNSDDKALLEFTFEFASMGGKPATRFLESLLKEVDVGVQGLEIKIEDAGKDQFGCEVLSQHNFLDKGKQSKKSFNFFEHESEGTKKIFAWGGFLAQAFQGNAILVVDEFDTKLHPLLTAKILTVFQASTNGNSQLIFSTHDTNLLNPELLRRDQIWFTEKDKDQATKLYSLLEFKGVRSTEPFEKNYIQGKYGAIPYLGAFTPWQGADDGKDK